MTQVQEYKDHEKAALRFLASGPDVLGVVDSEEKLAAAMVFMDMEKVGLVKFSGTGDKFTVSLTDVGVEAVVRIGL